MAAPPQGRFDHGQRGFAGRPAIRLKLGRQFPGRGRDEPLFVSGAEHFHAGRIAGGEVPRGWFQRHDGVARTGEQQPVALLAPAHCLFCLPAFGDIDNVEPALLLGIRRVARRFHLDGQPPARRSHHLKLGALPGSRVKGPAAKLVESVPRFRRHEGRQLPAQEPGAFHAQQFTRFEVGFQNLAVLVQGQMGGGGKIVKVGVADARGIQLRPHLAQIINL